jgi:hypothetical protein
MSRVSTLVAIVIVTVAGSAGCGSKSSSTASRLSPSTTTAAARISTTTTPKTYDPCKLSEADVSSRAGFAVRINAQSNPEVCDYRSTTGGGGNVYVTVSPADQEGAKTAVRYWLADAHPTYTADSGFPSWAFAAVPHAAGYATSAADLGGGQSVWIGVRAEPRDGNPSGRALALAHKFIG